MAVTISGTDGIVGAGFTVDSSGVSVTAGVGTFGSLAAPAAGLTGALPAISAASLTQIPAANIVGVCTSGLTKTGGFGVVLQVKQTVKTDTFSSTTTGSDVDITGLSVSITPTSASNKILVTYDTNISGSNAGYSGNIHLKRGSTKIYQGDAEGSRTRSTQFFITRNDTIGHLETIKVHGSFLDSPNTTSQVTYAIYCRSYSGTGYAMINNAMASLTVMEIAQ